MEVSVYFFLGDNDMLAVPSGAIELFEQITAPEQQKTPEYECLTSVSCFGLLCRTGESYVTIDLVPPPLWPPFYDG